MGGVALAVKDWQGALQRPLQRRVAWRLLLPGTVFFSCTHARSADIQNTDQQQTGAQPGFARLSDFRGTVPIDGANRQY